jgi:hypothetical protein
MLSVWLKKTRNPTSPSSMCDCQADATALKGLLCSEKFSTAWVAALAPARLRPSHIVEIPVFS